MSAYNRIEAMDETMALLYPLQFGTQLDDARNVVKQVLKVYDSSSRSYHGLGHVMSSMKTFNLWADAENLPSYQKTLGLLALLFHDVVYTTLYVPSESDEHVSARVATSLLGRIMLQDTLENFNKDKQNIWPPQSPAKPSPYPDMPDHILFTEEYQDFLLRAEPKEIVSYLIEATGMHLKQKPFSYGPRWNRPCVDNLVRLVMDADLSILLYHTDEVEKVWEQGVREEYRLVPDEVYIPERLKVYKAFLDRGFVFRAAINDRHNRDALNTISVLGTNLMATATPRILESLAPDIRSLFTPMPMASSAPNVWPAVGSYVFE